MIIAVIPAKVESSRLANKNMFILAGKPMIYHSIEYAKKSKLIEKLLVSTDSDEIADYAKSQGVEVIRRGIELGGETPIIEVYRHALDSLNEPSVSIVVGIQPDHPDRTLDVDKAIGLLQKGKGDKLITVDRNKVKNGSLMIMKREALIKNYFKNIIEVTDGCTNIHNLDDARLAESNLLKRYQGNEKS